MASLTDDTEPRPNGNASGGRTFGCRQRLIVLANLGLLLSIIVALASFLPVDWPWVTPFGLKFGSGVAVAFFLDVSFWLAGWSGSALGVILMAIAMMFGAYAGRALGLVGMALSLLMGTMVVLLILSDLTALPAARDGEHLPRGRLVIWIGLVGDIIVGALVWMMLWRF